ncbi:MAG: hypothetical protein A3E19_06180 [Planctomycetes bacterium RIFCSPHIGHO2_12_FULL_52_36]|nr:MAG: hypothetical protein A3D89_03990 [Planctomycetes bacterium RIFCSPHIGHO2_02_FULL_52_58]OHB94092.1 MAG: hypothetical protein A3E19_06180 [Planctomycetes bacterium RIFCSPHIGHO2_12_FULL_52_36]
MLVSLSDLHLQDIESQDPDTRSDQNVHHKAFIDFLQWISEEYLDKCKDKTEIKEIKIVLNGDIIDFLRTERWFNTPKRPYEDHHEKSISWEDPTKFPELDKKGADTVLLDVFKAVTGVKYKEEDFKKPDDILNIKTIKALAALRRFKREVNGEGKPYPCEQFEEFDKEYTKKLADWVKKLREKKANIQYLFIPGNHDRLVNVSSRLNASFREFFLIKNSQGTFSPERFPWELHMEDYKVFLRHGHVYDWTNGEENLVFQRKDARRIDYSFVWQKGIYKDYKDSKLYYNTPIGDLITIDLISYMPWFFINEYYKKRKNPNDLILACKRLREIDDIRPTLAVLPWLYELTKKPGIKLSWEDIEETVNSALDNTFFRDEGTAQGEFFRRWDSAHDRLFFDKSDIFENGMPWARKLLKAPSRLFEKVYSLTEKYMAGGKENPVPELIRKYNKRHKHPFMNSPQDYYIAGHIHSSSTHFLEEKKVYHCTGAWRTIHSRCLYKPEFKKIKSMNFIYFFRPGERKDVGGKVYIWRGLLEEEA